MSGGGRVTDDEFTDKQRAFVRHYVACLNGAEAARRAGYSPTTAREMAHENLTKPHIRAAIDAAMAEATMPRNEILGRLTAQARADLGDFFSGSGRGVKLDIKSAKTAGLMPLVKKYSKTKQGVSIELHDSQAALIQLGKHHKLWTDVQEVNGEMTVKGYTTKEASPDAWDDPPTE